MKAYAGPKWRGSRLWLLTLVVLFSIWPKGVGAQAQYRVVVLDPLAPTSLERELLTRLKGELGAAGFEVLSLPLATGSQPEVAVTVQGAELEPIAAFATAQTSRGGDALDASPMLRLWLSDRVSGALHLQEAKALEGSPAANLLAVQGVELLQARVTDRLVHPPAPPPRAVQRPAPVARPSAALTTAIDLGVLLESASGGAALTPLVHLSYAADLPSATGSHINLGARLSMAGLGAPTVLQASVQKVDVGQSFALLEGVLTLNPGGWLQPFGSLGAGAYRVSVEGTGPAPAVGRFEATLSPIAGIGVGLAAHPLERWVAKLEAQGLFAAQPTAVEIEATRVATFGRPLFVFSIGMGVVL